MRLVVPACLAIALLAGNACPSHAQLRHISSRLFPGGHSEIMSSFFLFRASKLLSVGANGDLFMLAEVDSFISFDNDPVGPGTVVVRMNSSQQVIWKRVLTIADLLFIGGIEATPDGGLALTGSIGGGFSDVLVLKFDPAGNIAWQRRYGDLRHQEPNAIAVTPEGDVVVVGSNAGNIDFGGGGIRTNGSNDIFIARIDGATGDHVWSSGFGQVGSQTGKLVTVGGDGRIALAGYMTGGSVSFGGDFLTAIGDGDLVIAGLDGDGSHLWSRLIGSNLYEAAVDLALDDSARVHVCGSFTRSLDTGGGLLVAPQTARATGFVASYDAGGGHRWSYMIPDTLESDASAIGTDRRGNCILLARTQSPVKIAFQSVPPGWFFVTFNSTGVVTSTLSLVSRPASGGDFMGILRVAGDDVFLAGHSSIPIDFGDGPMNPINYDVFLARFGTRRPAMVQISGLQARLVGGGVEIHWNTASAEALSNYTLVRRTGESSYAQWLHSGPANDGASTFLDRSAPVGQPLAYRVRITTALGDDVVSDWVRVRTPASTNELEQNAPNPFNPLTHFAYSLAEPAHVSIVIYDAAGAVVARLDQGMRNVGRHEASWGGHNASGNSVASGVYYYRLEGAGDVPARKMILLK